jgi:hypothetical protein
MTLAGSHGLCLRQRQKMLGKSPASQSQNRMQY